VDEQSRARPSTEYCVHHFGDEAIIAPCIGSRQADVDVGLPSISRVRGLVALEDRSVTP